MSGRKGKGRAGRRAPKPYEIIRLTIYERDTTVPWVTGLYITDRSQAVMQPQAVMRDGRIEAMARKVRYLDAEYHGVSAAAWEAHGAPRMPDAGRITVETNHAQPDAPARWRVAHTFEFTDIPVVSKDAETKDLPDVQTFRLGRVEDAYVLNITCALRPAVRQQMNERTGRMYVYEITQACLSTPVAPASAAGFVTV